MGEDVGHREVAGGLSDLLDKARIEVEPFVSDAIKRPVAGEGWATRSRDAFVVPVSGGGRVLDSPLTEVSRPESIYIVQDCTRELRQRLFCGWQRGYWRWCRGPRRWC